MQHVLKDYPNLPGKYLMISEGGLFDRPTAVQTVLGSCVTVTFFHAKLGIGALFHALLPHWRDHTRDDNKPEPYKFVDSAVERICTSFTRRSIDLSSLECKIFGGANGAFQQNIGMGRKNVKAAFEALSERRMRVAATDVGGQRGRKLLFLTHTGEVFIRRLG